MRPVPLSLFPGGPAALTLLCCLLSLNGCAPKIQDQVVATVGSDAITLADYERMYSKSSGTRDTAGATSVAEREKFLDLMVNYRLKLADASAQGIGGTPEVLSEIQQYKGSLAASFLTEREVVAPGLKRAQASARGAPRLSEALDLMKAAASFVAFSDMIESCSPCIETG